MIWSSRALVLAMGLTGLWAPVAWAQIANPSFEDLALGDGGFGAAPGWSTFLAGAGGTFNPSDAQFPSSTGDATPLPPPGDGINFGFYNDGGDAAGVGFFYQDLGNIPANASYVLNVAIGNRADIVDETFAIRIVAVDTVNSISTTIGEFSGDADTYAPAGAFLDAVASAPAASAFAGQLLQIHMVNTNTKAYDVGTSAGIQVIFDNVRLTDVNNPDESADYNGDGAIDAADYVIWRKNDINGPTGYDDWRATFGEMAEMPGTGSASGAVPEPTSLVLLVAGAAGVSVYRRRRPIGVGE